MDNPVVHLHIERGPAEPVEPCPSCGERQGHAQIKWPYPYPFNLSAYMLIKCPLSFEKEGDNAE